MSITQKQANNCVRAIEHFESIKPHKLDLKILCDSPDADMKICNSVACLAGWMPAILPRKYKWEYSLEREDLQGNIFFDPKFRELLGKQKVSVNEKVISVNGKRLIGQITIESKNQEFYIDADGDYSYISPANSRTAKFSTYRIVTNTERVIEVSFEKEIKLLCNIAPMIKEGRADDEVGDNEILEEFGFSEDLARHIYASDRAHLKRYLKTKKPLSELSDHALILQVFKKHLKDNEYAIVEVA